jgi:hypothetical protein
VAEADFTIKRGDTWGPLEAVLEDRNGPIDLTTASKVKMLMKSSTLSITTGPLTIPEQHGANKGKVEYDWEEGDLSIVGTYNVEFEIEWESGRKQTVPNGAEGELYSTVNVTQDLG